MTKKTKHPRSNFSYEDKATIYALDRATCAFSGKSLWLLDYGLSYYGSHDWVDHELPSARGGRANIENGVSASYEYNSKKGDNAKDTFYLFKRGRPTEKYFDYFGPLPPATARQLSRQFVESDWYFNRMIAMLLEALGERLERSKPGTVRLIRFSQKAAWRRLQDWRRTTVADASIEDRKLVLYPADLGTQKILALRGETSLAEFNSAARALFPYYRDNADLHCRFWSAKTAGDRTRIISKARRSRFCHPVTLKTLVSHHAFMRRLER